MSETKNTFSGLKMALKIVILMIVAEIVAIIAHAAAIISINIYYVSTLGDTPQATDAISAMVNNIWIQAGMIILQNVFFVLTALAFLKVDREKISPERLGLKLRKNSAGQFLGGAGLDMVFFPVAFAMMFLTGVVTYTGFGPSITGMSSVALSFGLMLATTLAIGIGEEVLFRGYLQGMLTKKYGIALALPVASLAFVLVHVLPKIMANDLSLLYFLSIMPIALILGYLFYKTGSLWASIGFHFLEDFMALNIFYTGNPAITGLYPLLVFSVPKNILPAAGWLGSWGDLIAFAVGVVLLALVYWFFRLQSNKPRSQ